MPRGKHSHPRRALTATVEQWQRWEKAARIEPRARYLTGGLSSWMRRVLDGEAARELGGSPVDVHRRKRVAGRR